MNSSTKPRCRSLTMKVIFLAAYRGGHDSDPLMGLHLHDGQIFPQIPSFLCIPYFGRHVMLLYIVQQFLP